MLKVMAEFVEDDRASESEWSDYGDYDHSDDVARRPSEGYDIFFDFGWEEFDLFNLHALFDVEETHAEREFLAEWEEWQDEGSRYENESGYSSSVYDSDDDSEDEGWEYIDLRAVVERMIDRRF